MHYFIIPGNPPAAYFYQQWAREIESEQAGAQVMVSRYPPIPPTTDSSEAMLKVLHGHLEQLKSFYELTGTPCNVIGHSLGGHFALRLLEQSPHLINKAILIHPFLRAPGVFGKMILKTAGSISYSPGLIQSILQLRKGLELIDQDLKHVSDAEISLAFHLARHEEATIGSDQTPIKFQFGQESKITVFHASKDTWCSPASIRELKKSVTVIECPEPHAFVTRKSHRQGLFKKLKEHHA